MIITDNIQLIPFISNFNTLLIVTVLYFTLLLLNPRVTLPGRGYFTLEWVRVLSLHR